MPNNKEDVGSQSDAPVAMVDDGREAFRAIYDREFDYVWHSLRRLGIPARDLPDVTHDVFLKLHKSLATYDSTRPFLHAIPPRDAARLALYLAEQADAGVASIAPERTWPADPTSLVNPVRAEHRAEHLDQIEAALGRER